MNGRILSIAAFPIRLYWTISLIKNSCIIHWSTSIDSALCFRSMGSSCWSERHRWVGSGHRRWVGARREVFHFQGGRRPGAVQILVCHIRKSLIDTAARSHFASRDVAARRYCLSLLRPLLRGSALPGKPTQIDSARPPQSIDARGQAHVREMTFDDYRTRSSLVAVASNQNSVVFFWLRLSASFQQFSVS